MWEFDTLIDVNNIYTNDIGAILSTYGVEAARAAITSEIASVFGVYGISVDKRHLSLIGDYMVRLLFYNSIFNYWINCYVCL
jgi:DNA-directed RNA polymerase I subunit RPA1